MQATYPPFQWDLISKLLVSPGCSIIKLLITNFALLEKHNQCKLKTEK